MSATLPIAARSWSPAELGEVRRRRREGASLEAVAAQFQTSRQEIDVVLWELLGSDPVTAARELDARTAERPNMPARIRRFLGW